MFIFIVRALVFDFVNSFVVGFVLMIVTLPFMAFSKSEKPGPLSYAIGIPVGITICAVQGIIIAAAVAVALQVDPNRWSVLWYIVGSFFSIPIAISRTYNTAYHSIVSDLGIIVSIISYVLACILPEYIPPMLGNMAIKFLL